MVGQPIEDLGRGQTEALELRSEVGIGHLVLSLACVTGEFPTLDDIRDSAYVKTNFTTISMS